MLSGRRQRHLSWAWSAKAKKLSDQAWRLYVQRREEERAQLAQAAKAAAERGGSARGLGRSASRAGEVDKR